MYSRRTLWRDYFNIKPLQNRSQNGTDNFHIEVISLFKKRYQSTNKKLVYYERYLCLKKHKRFKKIHKLYR